MADLHCPQCTEAFVPSRCTAEECYENDEPLLVCPGKCCTSITPRLVWFRCGHSCHEYCFRGEHKPAKCPLCTRIDGEPLEPGVCKNVCANWIKTSKCRFGASCLYCHNHEGEKKRRPSQSVRLRMKQAKEEEAAVLAKSSEAASEADSGKVTPETPATPATPESSEISDLVTVSSTCSVLSGELTPEVLFESVMDNAAVLLTLPGGGTVETARVYKDLQSVGADYPEVCPTALAPFFRTQPGALADALSFFNSSALVLVPTGRCPGLRSFVLAYGGALFHIQDPGDLAVTLEAFYRPEPRDVSKRRVAWRAPPHPQGYFAFRAADPALHADFEDRISESKKLATPYEAALVDLQYAWKMPRRSFDELRACRLAVQQAFEALPADMQDSVEVAYRLMTSEMELLSSLQSILHLSMRNDRFFGAALTASAEGGPSPREKMFARVMEFVTSARRNLTHAVQLATTTEIEAMVAAELHYSIMLTGAMEEMLFTMLKGERLALSKLEHWWQMPPEDRRKAVSNRAHAVRAIALLRDVYTDKAESDQRFGITKVIGAVEAARAGEMMMRDFAAEMRSTAAAMKPALEAGRYPIMKWWLAFWESPAASLIFRAF